VHPVDAGARRPFRWDLVTPDQLGSLLDGCPEPDLWFAGQLTGCAAKVLARAGGGDLYFVGRSLDSVFDLLSGALGGGSRMLHRLPFSYPFRYRGMTGSEVAQARDILATGDLIPARLARIRHPVALVDVVSQGTTFGALYRLLRDWVDEEREPWDVVRRKLRFVGVTCREETSPKTVRWQQREAWPRELPARSVVNVSLDPAVWVHLANYQAKVTSGFGPWEWGHERQGPRHDPSTRLALAEAVAVVAYGRRRQTRTALARAMAAEPAYAERWLRTLAHRLNVG
jgi:hypothetical protein